MVDYCFKERPKGLDFSLRVKKRGITLPGNHGYALTSKKALENILRHIPYKNLSLLDIGSGKGGVVCFALELGCRHAEGIEYEVFLHNIAVKNISLLGYGDRAVSHQMDARDFKRYADFDIYYLFNPFDPAIYAQVIDELVRQNKLAPVTNQPKYLVCYGDTNVDAINHSGFFTLLHEAPCPYRGNVFRIYSLSFT